MDFTKEEANIVYEDRIMDLEPHVDGSDDEENQRELEEMLYSQVYFDSSSFEETSTGQASSPIISVTVTTIGEENPQPEVFAPEGINRPYSNSNEPKFLPGCSRSEFNHPTRTSVSRYYDVNQDQSNANPVFVAPSSPSQKRTTRSQAKKSVPNPFSDKLLPRSANKQPSATHQNSAVGKATAAAGRNNPGDHSSYRMNASPLAQQKKYISTAIAGKESSEENVSNSKENELSTTKVDDKLLNKVSQSTTSTSKKSKLPTFESKVSKVLSSMLDDESRSSMEENISASICTNQNSMSESGWSVGMSWADMSSKYSFEVDSIEEESVSSLQLQESSIAADSHTPDILARLEDHENTEDNNEPTRYQLTLKVKNKPGKNNLSETDSESEVGSVVEVALPVKAAPLLVDISDGEYTPVNETKNNTESDHSNEITVLLSKGKESPLTPIPLNIIDISSDDDLMILEVVDPSKAKNLLAQKGQKKRSVQTEGKSEDSIPPKRLSYQKEKNCEATQGEQDPIKQGNAILNEPLIEISKGRKRGKLERWLHNPIKAFKYLDHDRYLKNMSDDPDLWQLCPADRSSVRTPRGPKCTNCNQFGHKNNACRAPVKIVMCRMCGMSGHSETRCRQKMCLKCGRKNNIYTDRCKRCTNHSTLCKICDSRAHGWKVCPDLWRRYHLTTSHGDLMKHVGVDVRERSDQWCSNCAGNGHLSHECKKLYWKCESISPYIKSYATISAEEEKCGGVAVYSMMLTSESAKLLQSTEGKDFLECLSMDSHEGICGHFDVADQKLTMEGTTMAVNEVRCRVKEWISDRTGHKTSAKEVSVTRSEETGAQEEPSNETHPNETATVGDDMSASPLKVASPIQAQIMRTVWDLPATLPMDHNELANVIERELKIVDSPLFCEISVHQLYDKLLEMGSIKEQKRYSRVLSIILLGKCGLRGGSHHISALKKLLLKLRGRKGHIRVLYNSVKKHYHTIFGGVLRADFGALVDRFYSNENFVKQFECRKVQNEVDQPFNPQTDLVPVESLRVQQTSIPQEIRPNPRESKVSKKIGVLEKQVRQAVPAVRKILSSRFIVTKDYTSLQKRYRLLCRNSLKGTARLQLLQGMKGIIDKLCKSYDIKL